MANYLYIHRENTQGPQARFRGAYEVRSVDFELQRGISRRGEAAGSLRSGNLRVVLNGFADGLLLSWLFDTLREEDGEIVSTDGAEQVLEKMAFRHARLIDFRTHYDSRVSEGLITLLTIQAGEIATDNDLHYSER